MSTYILIKENQKKPSVFKSKVNKLYDGVIECLEKSGLRDNASFIGTLKKSANMAYLEFEGIVDGELIKFEGFSHSKVHKFDINKIHDTSFHKLLLEKFYTELNTSYYRDGYVNSDNNTLTFINSSSRRIKDNHWNRSTDAESRLLENLILQCNNGVIQNGFINIYTTFEPCLSCSSKLTEFLKKNLNVKMTVYYDRKYGNRRER